MKPVAYAPAQKFLHWVIFILVAGLYLITFAEDLFARDNAMRAMVWWLHISFGLLLFVLVLWRFALRLTRSVPAFPSSLSSFEKSTAKATHWLLYFLLIAVPVAGMVLAELRGNPLSFFGIFTIPQLIVPDRALAGSVKEIHNILATAIILIAALHAGAALWHQFYKKDGILQRILPQRK